MYTVYQYLHNGGINVQQGCNRVDTSGGQHSAME